MSWSSYATAYDILADNNPAYQHLMSLFLRDIASYSFVEGAQIVDIGAGTGNFSVALAQRFPACQVVHLDDNSEMNALAALKATRLGLRNWKCEESTVSEYRPGVGNVACAVAIHSLYTLSNPREALNDIASWLTPGGSFLTCDLGRRLRIFDWICFLASHSLRNNGIGGTLRLWKSAGPARHANREICKHQESGRYWLHSGPEFRDAVESAGLVIDRIETVYRGCSDYVVAHKEVTVGAGTEMSTVDQ